MFAMMQNTIRNANLPPQPPGGGAAAVLADLAVAIQVRF